MTEKSKVRYISREELVERIKRQFSPEYTELFLIQAGYSPKLCPKCGSTSFTTLWLAKPNDAIDGKMCGEMVFLARQTSFRHPLPFGDLEDSENNTLHPSWRRESVGRPT